MNVLYKLSLSLAVLSTAANIVNSVLCDFAHGRSGWLVASIWSAYAVYLIIESRRSW